MNTKQIIAKLKNQIAKKGYSENLGQVELNKYNDYLFYGKGGTGLTYEQKTNLYKTFSNEIDNL